MERGPGEPVEWRPLQPLPAERKVSSWEVEERRRLEVVKEERNKGSVNGGM